MNYLNTVKYDDTKRTYTDSFGYIVAPLKSTRLSVRDNEEVEESKDNIVMLQGGQSGQGVAVSADFSKDANVDITIEPKGTGVLKSTTDIVSNTSLENQVRLSSNNATSSGIITPQGAGTNVHLDLRAKGSGGELKFHGDLATYLSVSKTPVIKVNSGNPTANLTLQSVGSGSYVTLRNNLAKGTLAVRTDYPADSGVTLEAQSSNASCNILLQPKSGYVSVPAQLQSTFGMMIRRHSANQTTNNGSEYIVQFDTAQESSFGTNGVLYSWDNGTTFTNLSGTTMKIMVVCTGVPNSPVTAYGDCHIRVWASGGGIKYNLPRTNFHMSGTQYGTLTTSACFNLANNESFAWRVYTTPAITLDSSSNGVHMMILQVP